MKNERAIRWSWLLDRVHLLKPRSADFVNACIFKPRDADKADAALEQVTAELKDMIDAGLNGAVLWGEGRVSIRVATVRNATLIFLCDELARDVIAVRFAGGDGQRVSEALRTLQRSLQEMKLAHAIWKKGEDNDECPF